MTKTLTTIAIGAIIIIIATLFMRDLIVGTPDPVPIDTVIVTKVDTTEILKKYASTIKPIYRTRYIKSDGVNMDSLKSAMIDSIKAMPDTVEYVAEAVAHYEDSSMVVDVRYVSRMPLSSLGYFDIKGQVKELTINITEETTITVEKQKGWFEAFIDRFGVGVYAGMGFDASGKLSPQVGVGLMFEF